MFLRNRRSKKPRALLFLYLWKRWDSSHTSAESLEQGGGSKALHAHMWKHRRVCGGGRTHTPTHLKTQPFLSNPAQQPAAGFQFPHRPFPGCCPACPQDAGQFLGSLAFLAHSEKAHNIQPDTGPSGQARNYVEFSPGTNGFNPRKFTRETHFPGRAPSGLNCTTEC